MVMILVIVAVLVVIVLLTLKFVTGKRGGSYDDEGDDEHPIIHMSGIYSIVRKSPRESLAARRPTEAGIKAFLEGAGEDVNGKPLNDFGRAALLKHWKVQMEANLREIETGDKSGVIFYYYDFPLPCPVCADFINKGNFVTREEIYKHPEIIPPFHLGCTCSLTAHRSGGEDTLRETVLVGMVPFFVCDASPALPEWTNIVSLPASAEAKS